MIILLVYPFIHQTICLSAFKHTAQNKSETMVVLLKIMMMKGFVQKGSR